MCSRVTCSRCKKYTWSGCGQHVNQVMAGIPKSQQCTCIADKAAAKANNGGLFSRFLGR